MRPSAIRRQLCANARLQQFDFGRRHGGHRRTDARRRRARRPKCIEIGKAPLNGDFPCLDRLEACSRPQLTQRFIRDTSGTRRQRRLLPERAHFDLDRVPGKSAAQHVPGIGRDVPPGRTTRAISATPFTGSGTKKITSAMVAASNWFVAERQRHCVALLKFGNFRFVTLAGEGELSLRRIDALHFASARSARPAAR